MDSRSPYQSYFDQFHLLSNDAVLIEIARQICDRMFRFEIDTTVHALVSDLVPLFNFLVIN